MHVLDFARYSLCKEILIRLFRSEGVVSYLRLHQLTHTSYTSVLTGQKRTT